MPRSYTTTCTLTPVSMVAVELLNICCRKRITAALKKFFKTISRRVIFTNMVLALLRYLIFSHQFYFLINLFNPQISYLEIMMGITTVYLISSIIPMLFIFDVVVKSGIAVWVFGYLGLNELAIVTTITLMWILNFVIPSIFGSYFVLNFSFNNTSKVIDKS